MVARLLPASSWRARSGCGSISSSAAAQPHRAGAVSRLGRPGRRGVQRAAARAGGVPLLAHHVRDARGPRAGSSPSPGPWSPRRSCWRPSAVRSRGGSSPCWRWAPCRRTWSCGSGAGRRACSPCTWAFSSGCWCWAGPWSRPSGLGRPHSLAGPGCRCCGAVFIRMRHRPVPLLDDRPLRARDVRHRAAVRRADGRGLRRGAARRCRLPRTGCCAASAWCRCSRPSTPPGMALVQREGRRFFCYVFLSHSALVLVGVDTIARSPSGRADPDGLTGGLCVWLSVGLALAGFGLTLRAPGGPPRPAVADPLPRPVRLHPRCWRSASC